MRVELSSFWGIGLLEFSVGSMSTLRYVLQMPEQRLKVRHLILLFLAVDVFKQIFVQSAQEPVAA